MPIHSVSDTGSNEEENIARAVRALGRSADRQAVFEALYFHKKKIKTVQEIAERTGLTRKGVLTHGKYLVGAGLAEQTKQDGDTAYGTIPFFQHHKTKILARKGKPSPAPRTANNAAKKNLARRKLGGTAKTKKGIATTKLYDVFISHASEDKEPFVEGLADRLRSEGISVWYDKFTLKWGDSLREQIDKGLNSSRFGIVVLSKAFFRKPWPKKELDGLFALEVSGKAKILPIWHDLSEEEVQEYSPMLAGRLALASDHPVQDMIVQLKELIGE